LLRLLLLTLPLLPLNCHALLRLFELTDADTFGTLFRSHPAGRPVPGNEDRKLRPQKEGQAPVEQRHAANFRKNLRSGTLLKAVLQPKHAKYKLLAHI
jgi:hypothetical protein